MTTEPRTLAPTKNRTGYGQALSLDRFARKYARLSSRCKDCVSTYTRAHYHKVAQTRRAEIQIRRATVRRRLQSLLDEARLGAACSTCGSTDVPLGLLSSHGTGAQLVKREQQNLLADALADPVWRCRRCCGSQSGVRERGTSQVPESPTLEVAILDALHQGASTIPEVLTSVNDLRPPTRKAVADRLAAMARTGEISRLDRGRYTPMN